jgi:hypothetical protein
MPWVQNVNTIRLSPPEGLADLSPDDWIEIRCVYTAGMRQRFMSKAMSLRLTATELVNDHVDVFAYRQSLLEEIVVAWSDPAPVTAEALMQLHPEVQDWIASEFDRLAAGGKDLGEASTPSTSPLPARRA